MRSRTTSARRWAASSPSTSGPPVPCANPAEQVGAARQRTDHRWRTRRRWVGGVNAVGRGGDPGVPGVRQGGGTGDPGSGARGRQRGTIGAPRQEGAHDPAGQGAAPVTRQAREEGLDLLLQQPFRGRAGHSILRVSRSFHDHDTDGSARAFGGTETVDNLPANPPPFKGDWGGAATAITRDAWVIPFLSLLGYDLHANPHPYAIDEARFAISHRAGACPVMSPFRFRCVFCATQPRAQQPPARKIHPRARSCLVEHPLQVRLDAARRQPQRRRDRCIRMSSRD